MESSASSLVKCIQLSAGPGPHLLVTAGVHGDEIEPMVAVHRLADCAAPLLERGQLSLCPVVNEAAMRRGRRTAEDGLDLARVCPGSEHGSLTERVAMEVSHLIRQADVYIDLHTGGVALDIWPMAGYMLHQDTVVSERQRTLARAFGLPIVWGTDAGLPGRTLSVARDARVPAIYAEYGGGGRFNEEAALALMDGCLRVMRALRMTAPVELDDRPCQVVEDPRPGSGHMQVCHPAPDSGLFLPRVDVGQLVARDELVGTIVDVHHDGSATEVRADRTGRILVLRVLPAVEQGDGLAVILETGEVP